MIRVGIVGATGYGGRELLRLLGLHPEIEIAAITSTSVAGTRVDEVLPGFRGLCEMTFEPFEAESLAGKCDVVFLGVPSTESMGFGAALRGQGARVIDLGPDFRLKDEKAFETYYGTKHEAAGLLAEAVYGLPPVYRSELAGANLVAVPGCYPIGVVLPLKPVVDSVTLEAPAVVDSISGVSGAGRSLTEALHFADMNDNVWAYKVGAHQHVPEMEQELGGQTMVQFTPHVGPYTRGILSTITIRPSENLDLASLYESYDKEPFVRVLGEGKVPDLNGVRSSNFCDIGWVRDERTGNTVIVSALDNLMGGTAGIALQCMNIMFGLEETTGLTVAGMSV